MTLLTAKDTLEDAHFESLVEAVPETVERPVAVSTRETEKSERCATLRIYVSLTSLRVGPGRGDDSTLRNVGDFPHPVAHSGITVPRAYHTFSLLADIL